ncbi:alpha/beta hydrolase [Ornithinimicrobium faecis]|uniref:Alpha/beta hydrolase n=1 Tax=Ornithinimicrobium faecis TaxID=2934158 RepID=A0ABY4YT21_9MICO|nr:alpha/beta hydrolase [Ornithinimicrobium sp. HY1793]USQ79912.1 alpha/beta hydrolase [Ornithinimicrobium sp. HY1793]
MLVEEFHWHGKVVRWGRSGSGLPVVFCHGTPWSSRVWQAVAASLVPEFTVYLWDMPGYGQSSKHPDHRVSLDVQGELFADLMEHWDLDAPHVVTHDIGGAVALRAHLLHDAPFRSLLLADVVALAPWGSPFFTLVREHADVFGALPQQIHLGALRAYLAGATHRGLTDEQESWLTEPWADEVGQAAFYRQIAQADQTHTDEIETLYPRLDLPVLIAWGTEDVWIPVDRAHRLQALIPGADLRLVPEAGHLLQLDQPEAVTGLVHQWLSGA